MLTIQEQELHINSSRDEKTATAYCSDTHWIAKFDKLVEKAPDLFKVVAQNDVSKTYEFPKKLITIRSQFVKLNLTDEQRQARLETLKKANMDRKNGNQS